MPAPCQLTQVHLNTEKQRALAAINGLFYAGTLSAIQAPDIYGITLDGERGNRPHIYSREGILQDAVSFETQCCPVWHVRNHQISTLLVIFSSSIFICSCHSFLDIEIKFFGGRGGGLCEL
jgi:hypothetical protein